MSNCLWPHELQPAGLLCPWNFPSKNTGVGCHFLLQGIFLTQGSNLYLLLGRRILYPLSYLGSPQGSLAVANWSWCPLEWNRWTAWSVSNSQKPEPSYHNGESWPFVQLLALRHFTNVEFLNWMVGFFPFRNDPTTMLHEYIINLPSSLLQRDLHPFA